MSGLGDRLSVGRLTVDLAAVRANYRSIARRSAPATVGAVVKADAYSLGARRVAAALVREGCRDFFVAHLSEARALSDSIPDDARIFVLHGIASGAEIECAALGAIPVLNSLDQAHGWRALAAERGRRLPAAIQFDTGMARMGLTAGEVELLAAETDLFDHIDLRLVMSHLAIGDEPRSPVNDAQVMRFQALAARLPAAPRSLANSGGAFLGSAFQLDLVRPGVALYGAAAHAGGAGLAPAVRLDARVVQLREIPAGTGVGYGHAFTSAEPMRLAIVGIGYADGCPRDLTGRGAAYFDGVRLPFVGRVSMDSIILDIGGLPVGALAPGDEVELIGPNQSLDDFATAAGSIAHEILTGMGQRLYRTYHGDHQ